MIENLNGIRETVNYRKDTRLRLYNNVQIEDYPDHWHTPVEIIMPIENIYSVVVGGHTITLNPTDIIFICPGVIHSLKAHGKGRRIIFQAEITMFTAIREFESILSLMSPVLKITKENPHDIHKHICNLLLQINEEYNNSNILMETIIYSKLLNIFVLVGRNYTSNSVFFNGMDYQNKEYTEKFIFICNYINEHCTEDLNLDKIAKLAGFSKYHFTRLFKQITTTTFYKYLNLKRIEHAQKLLANPGISVTEVALNSGFSSLSAFIRMFKLINHCTPTEYRNMFINVTQTNDL
ncbi:MAG: AraC family transcriptional regulator [Lachnospiraceae bacterium]|jgi:AraC-type DNA-binding domain-containing proteins|nr:helix-turn-helix transcriptional regulator [Lachnospiraceae bacterium]